MCTYNCPQPAAAQHTPRTRSSGKRGWKQQSSCSLYIFHSDGRHQKPKYPEHRAAETVCLSARRLGRIRSTNRGNQNQNQKVLITHLVGPQLGIVMDVCKGGMDNFPVCFDIRGMRYGRWVDLVSHSFDEHQLGWYFYFKHSSFRKLVGMRWTISEKWSMD